MLVSSQLSAGDVEFAHVLAAVQDGAGAVISGDAGVGKTALARAVAHSVSGDGNNVVWIVGTAAGRDTSQTSGSSVPSARDRRRASRD